MADAGIDLSIRTDSTQAAAGVREVEEAIRRAGRTSEDAGRRSADAAQRNLQLYREETRILDLRARGRNDIADALRREVDVRRLGLRLERELHVGQQEGLALARRRLALEQQLADQAARRGAGGSGGGGGNGNGGGGGGPPPGGGPGRGGRGNPPGGGGLRDFGIAYQIAQDGIQGGLSQGLAGVAIGTANQVPQLIDLVRKYRKTALAATAATATIGSYMGYAYMREQMDDSDESAVGQRRIRNFRASQIRQWNRDREKLGVDGTAAGTEAGEMHGRIARDLDFATGIRQQQAAIAAAAAAQEHQNRRAAAGAGETDPIARIEKLAELEKEHLREQDRAARLTMDDELRIARIEADTAQKRKEDLAAIIAADKQRIELGRMATDGEIKGVAAAKAEAAGLDERMKAAQARLTDLEQRSRLMNLEMKSVRPLETAGIDAQAKRDKDAAGREILVQGGAAAKNLWNIVSGFVDETARKVKAHDTKTNNARSATDQDMEIMELRARGQGRKADRLERKNAINDRAKDLVDTEGRTPAEAAKLAEREYDLHNPSRRIRGAGFRRAGGGEATGSGLDQPIGGGIDRTGGLDALRRLNDRGRKVGGSAGDKPSFAGLDGLDALQNRNRRIRGAGFKESKSVTETQASPATAAAAAGGAALPAILNAISGLGRKFDALISASRSIRR